MEKIAMKATPSLTAERLREVLHYDPETGVFTRTVSTSNRWKAGQTVGGKDTSTGYIRIWVDGTIYQAHRLAWLYVHGVWPKDQIDHINRDGFDNRLANLREATNAQNCQNRAIRVNNRSGFRGVYWKSKLNKWVASATVNGRQKHLGVFSDIKDAVAARAAVESKHYPFLQATDNA